jgi:hypothetical protein
MLLPVECGQQLRGGNEALNVHMKPKFNLLVKQKIKPPVNYNFRNVATGSWHLLWPVSSGQVSIHSPL